MYIKILKMFCLPLFLPLHSNSPDCCLARHTDMGFPKGQCSSHLPTFGHKRLAAQNSVSPIATWKTSYTASSHSPSKSSHYVPKVHPEPLTLLLLLPLSLILCIFIYFLLFRAVATGFNTVPRNSRSQINAGQICDRHSLSLLRPLHRILSIHRAT